jgi:type II secretory pathway pseudopilin PulG
LAQVHPPLEHAQRDQRPSRNRGGEAGYALTELLVVTSLLAIVLGAILTLGETSQRIAPRESERAQVIRESQTGMDRMTRELRETHNLVSQSASKVDAWVPVLGGGQRRVAYECDIAHPTVTGWTRCMRYDVAADGTKSNGQVIVDRVLNGAADSTLPVFLRGSAPTTDYVKTTVEVAARGDLQNGYGHRILLEDGFYMRNLDAN